jgi:hypothetical protein
MARQRYSPITTVNDANWAAEPIDYRNTIPGGVNFDASTLIAVDGVKITVGAAGAAVAATSIPLLSAIAKGDKIPSGTILTFGGAKFATLTAEAKEGDTALTVSAIAAALAANDVATYAGVGYKSLYSGTLIGRTGADRVANLPFKLANDAMDDYYINAFDNFDVGTIPEITLLRHGAMVFRAGLRNYAALNAATKAKLENWYQFID